LSQGASLLQIQDYVAKWKPSETWTSRTCPHSASNSEKKSASCTGPSANCKDTPKDPGGRIADIGDEAVDTLILLMSIVNRCGINLEDAFRAKEARNESRVWI
jgi:hypothetical protein